MDFLGQVLLDIGIVALLLGYLGVCFCGFGVSLGRGLVTLLFPIIGLGVAIRRFPWLIWMLGAGIALIAIAAILT